MHSYIEFKFLHLIKKRFKKFGSAMDFHQLFRVLVAHSRGIFFLSENLLKRIVVFFFNFLDVK